MTGGSRVAGESRSKLANTGMGVPGGRILHVIDHLNAGGAQTLLLGLAAEQRARGVDVRVAALHGPGILSAEFERAGLAPVHLAASKTDPRLAARLVREVRAFRPDVVHAHLVASSALCEYLRFAFPRGARVVCHVHNLFAAHGEDSYQDWLEHALYRRCDLAVACSRAAAETVRARPGGCGVRLAVAINGIPDARYIGRDDAARGRIRAEFGVAEGDRALLCVGRQVVQKNLEYALAIVAELHRIGRPVKLWLAGDGPRRGALERRAAKLGIADACRFLGHRGDVDALMSAADLLLLPSREEACPMVIAEAAARELPTVAAAFASAPELVKDGKTGLVVPLDAPREAAGRIAELLRDDAVRGVLGKNAFEFAKRRFSMRTLAARLEKLYASLR